jgi:histidinol-phosphate aminotransferase
MNATPDVLEARDIVVEVARRVQATIRADVRALSAYEVAKAPGMIKLDANESPYGMPAALVGPVAAALAGVAVNRYPDGPGDAVKEALRRAFTLQDTVGLTLGNGADELLQLITTAVAQRDAVVLAPEPTFVMYRVYALHARLRYVGVPLRGDLTLDVDAMLAAIARLRPALVWLPYPNNPTGNLFPRAAVERIIEAAPGLVVVDEAYYAFAEDAFLPQVLEYPNVVVVRTLSKIGGAGLRLGYAAAHPAWIAELEKVRSPYNVNALTQAVAPVMLDHLELFADQVRAGRHERARLLAALGAMPLVSAFPSQANFVVVRVPDAPRWFADLRAGGILVKNLHGSHPLLAHCLRITVGTAAENDALLAALSQLR